MNDIGNVLELTSASWEQWIGAAMRQAHFQRLRATARPRRRQPSKTQNGDSCANLLWMLVASSIGFWLLRC